MLNWQKVTKAPTVWLLLIQWVIALEWLKSSINKFTAARFMDNIHGTITAMVNQTSFEFYGDFLDSVDPVVWGNLTRYSELAVGLILLLSGWHLLKTGQHSRRILVLLTVALFYGAFMNLNFYLAGGWDSQAVVGLNMIMGLTQVILGSYYLHTLLAKK